MLDKVWQVVFDAMYNGLVDSGNAPEEASRLAADHADEWLRERQDRNHDMERERGMEL